MSIALFQKYRDFVLKNRDLRPRFSEISVPVKQNSFQYVGGQILNGSLLAVVNSAQKMMRYRISDGRFDFFGDFGIDDFKWTGGCCFAGKIYMFPRSSRNLLVYDPETESFETVYCGTDYEGEHHYGGVCTEDGIIYQPPRNTDHILKWDIKTGTCERITVNDGIPCRYCGCVIHPNGSVYMIPEKDLKVLKINLAGGTVCEIGEPVSGLAFDPAVAADGNIYGFRTRTGILKIDTESDRVSILHENAQTRAYGSKASVNGKIYSLPGYSRDVWEFDPFDGSLNKCYELTVDRAVHYAGGAVDTNGSIYALPVHAEAILKMCFDGFAGEIPDDIYRTFFCDCY